MIHAYIYEVKHTSTEEGVTEARMLHKDVIHARERETHTGRQRGRETGRERDRGGERERKKEKQRESEKEKE